MKEVREISKKALFLTYHFISWCKTGNSFAYQTGRLQEKVEAAWSGGIRNFEGTLGGFGGCPMTGYELLGNLDTYKLVDWCKTQGIETGIDENNLLDALNFAGKLLQ